MDAVSGFVAGAEAAGRGGHLFRPRRSRCGELAQWDTSEHDWLEGRGGTIYLISMIDDATSRLVARFVDSDSTEQNMRLLWRYLERNGRPAAFYTDKASLFRSTPKTHRKHTELCRDERDPLPPTQIGRALHELGITWIAAHSPQAKGRVERSFQTAPEPGHLHYLNQTIHGGLRDAQAHLNKMLGE